MVTCVAMAAGAALAVVVDLELDQPSADEVERQVTGVGQLLLVGWLYAAKPLLAAFGAGVVVACWRVRRRVGLVALAAVLVPNVAVQVVKHAPALQATAPGGLNPLSGHAALVTSVCLTWLAVAPLRGKWTSAVCVAVTVAGVLLGVGAVWHSTAQLLVPLAVGTVAVLLAMPLLPGTGPGRTAAGRYGVLSAGCAAASAALATTYPVRAMPPPDRVQPMGPVPTLVVVLAVIAVTAAVLAVGRRRGLPAPGEGVSPGASPSTDAATRSAGAASR